MQRVNSKVIQAFGSCLSAPDPSGLMSSVFDRSINSKTPLFSGGSRKRTFRYSLATADIGLVSLESELSGLAVPSKAYYFLAANVPLIAVCDSSNELAELIHDFGCGVVIPPGQPQAIVHANRPGFEGSWCLGTLEIRCPSSDAGASSRSSVRKDSPESFRRNCEFLGNEWMDRNQDWYPVHRRHEGIVDENPFQNHE